MPTVTRSRVNPKVAAELSQDGIKSAWDLIDSLRILLYGESGTGKTTFWATFPGTILALICSGGRKPGELRSIDTPENRKRITAVVINSTDDFHREMERADRFDNVVLDHISGLQNLDLMDVLGIDEIPTVKNWGMASDDQYGQAARHTIKYCEALLNLRGNVVIVGQERVFKPKEETGIAIAKIGCDVMPSVHKWLAPACDYVLQTFKRQRSKVSKGEGGIEITIPQRGVDYCLRTEEHEVIMTKFRMVKERKLKHPLPDVIVDPTYDKLVKIIKG